MFGCHNSGLFLLPPGEAAMPMSVGIMKNRLFCNQFQARRSTLRATSGTSARRSSRRGRWESSSAGSSSSSNNNNSSNSRRTRRPTSTGGRSWSWRPGELLFFFLQYSHPLIYVPACQFFFFFLCVCAHFLDLRRHYCFFLMAKDNPTNICITRTTKWLRH